MTYYLYTFHQNICTPISYYINNCSAIFFNISIIIITFEDIFIIINITIIIIWTIIIRLKQCNTQMYGILFSMTSQFVENHSNASSNSTVQHIFVSEFVF